jgi:hypothetical protein
MHLWLLSGYAGSGKDTIAAMMLEILNSQGQGQGQGQGQAAQVSFAGAVKDEVAAMYEVTRESLDTQAGKARILHFADGTARTVRDLLIQHAESTKAAHGPAVWANRLSFEDEGKNHWILSDWRFLAEREALQQRFPQAVLHTVRITRPSVQPLDTYTEHELAAVVPDHTIDNSDSLLYARNQVKNMLDAISSPTHHTRSHRRWYSPT